MTDAPKTIWVSDVLPDESDWAYCSVTDDWTGSAHYTLTSHAEAEKREAVNAALERAADCAHSHLPRDHWEARDSTPEYNAACRDITKAIRAMKEEQ